MSSNTMEAAEPATENTARTIRFPEGIPGFPQRSAWQVLHSDEIAPFLVLATVDGEPEVRMVILDPRLAFGDYAEAIDQDALRARLGGEGEGELLVYCLVSIGAEGRATANLRAPVVIDPATMRGKQFILEDASLPLQADILQDD